METKFFYRQTKRSHDKKKVKISHKKPKQFELNWKTIKINMNGKTKFGTSLENAQTQSILEINIYLKVYKNQNHQSRSFETIHR